MLFVTCVSKDGKGGDELAGQFGMAVASGIPDTGQ